MSKIEEIISDQDVINCTYRKESLAGKRKIDVGATLNALKDTANNKHKQAIQSLLEEQYQKGFIDGSHTTGEQANEIHAVELNEQLDEIIESKKLMVRVYTRKHTGDSGEFVKGYLEAHKEFISNLEELKNE